MKSTTKTVYKCDHCGKNYLVKSACEKHENFCPTKPENKAPCFNCKFLQRKIVVVEGEDFDKELKTYECGRMGFGVFPPIAARKGLVDKYSEHFESQIQMPYDCTLYEPSYEPLF